MDPCKQGCGVVWGYSDSDSGSDSGLLIDSDSGSYSDPDSGSDTKYKMNSTLIAERVSAVQARKETWHFLFILAFIPSDGRPLIPVISHTSWIASAPPQKKVLRLPDHLFVQIMFVWSRSIASTAFCLSRDPRSSRSSLIEKKSRSTLTSVDGSAANAWLESRTAVG